MSEEKTSYKIMRTDKFDDAVFYTANCGCANPECQIVLLLENDPDIGYIILEMYHDLKYCSWWKIDTSRSFEWVKNPDWRDRLQDWSYKFQDYYYRLKGALRLLFTGRIKLEESFLFRDEEQIEAFITALREGQEYIKKSIEERNKKEEVKDE